MGPETFGELVRRWRDRLDPADAGHARAPTRRVPGLRHEELASLAGLSVEYVVRLEQGRATRPSAQVVAAIALALQLSPAERDLLYSAGGLLPPQDGSIDLLVPASVQRLATRLGDVPVGIFAAEWTLLWWNDMWTALHGDPAVLPPRERNIARMLFGDGPARSYLRPISSAAGPTAFPDAIVSDLKATAARYPQDASLSALMDDVNGSDLFRTYWQKTGSVTLTTDLKTIDHPEVGRITVDCDILLVPGAEFRIVTYTAAAGTSDSSKLDLLRVMHGRTESRVQEERHRVRAASGATDYPPAQPTGTPKT
jgi:transcriptional regulator with XRE-family HTH domain